MPLEVKSRYPYNDTGVMPVELDHDYYDPLALLGMWVGATSRIDLQTSVLVLPYRNPIVTAKILSSLDALSGGRLVLAVGVGWMKEEFEILHSPDFDRRGQVTDEYIQIFRTLWEDDRPEFHGEYYDVQGFVMLPKPARRPRLPILIGGSSRPALRRAARLGDGWQPIRVSTDEVRAGLASIREQAKAAGRDLDNYIVSIRLGMRVTSTPTERKPSEEPRRVVVGTPDEVTAQIQEYIDAGATELMLDTRTCSRDRIDETIELFAREVLPRFR
jgi:probable F420-dependent oxidoreductase